MGIAYSGRTISRQANPQGANKKTMPKEKQTNPQAELCIGLFKNAYTEKKLPRQIGLASVAMPRETYAACVASACAAFVTMSGAPVEAAVEAVMLTPVGNPSQLLGVLKADGFLTLEAATAVTDSWVAKALAFKAAQAAAAAAAAKPSA